MSNSAAWGIARTWVTAPDPDTRVVNMNHLGRALTEAIEPPVSVLFVYNSNVLATSQDQGRVLRGLEREDLFTVVFDQVMTHTAQYADVLLPATTFLEGYDLARTDGPISLHLAKPVVEPVGEARSNADVFGDLLARLDLAEDGEPEGELEELLHVLSHLRAQCAGRGPLPGADWRLDSSWLCRAAERPLAAAHGKRQTASLRTYRCRTH